MLEHQFCALYPYQDNKRDYISPCFKNNFEPVNDTDNPGISWNMDPSVL